MKPLLRFIKTTAIGGLLVLLPLLLLNLVLNEALGLIVVLAEPLEELFPKGTLDGTKYPIATGLIVITGVSFLIGLALRSESGKRLGRWVDRTVLERLPVYSVLKNLIAAFMGSEKEGAFKIAVLQSSEGEYEIVYIVEDFGDDYVTVFVPWSPTVFSGSVKIVNRNRLEILDATLGEVSRVLGNWGVGARDLLNNYAACKVTSTEPNKV
jgi:uncharacterized membrane protein